MLAGEREWGRGVVVGSVEQRVRGDHPIYVVVIEGVAFRVFLVRFVGRSANGSE